MNKIYKIINNYNGWFYVLPAMFVLICVVIYPVLYSIAISFYNRPFSHKYSTFVGLDNFSIILDQPLFRKAFVNTIVYTSSSFIITFILGFTLALLMTKIKFGNRIFQLLLIVPMAMAPLVVGLTWRWMYNPLFGLINWFFKIINVEPQAWLASQETSMIALIWVDVWQWTSLVFLILYAGLSGLPKEPFEAANLDGANSFTIFTKITIPLLKPVILVVLLLRTVDAFRTFDSAYVLTDGGPGDSTELLSLYIYRHGFFFNNQGEAAAGALIMLSFISIISVVYFKYLYKVK